MIFYDRIILVLNCVWNGLTACARGNAQRPCRSEALCVQQRNLQLVQVPAGSC